MAFNVRNPDAQNLMNKQYLGKTWKQIDTCMDMKVFIKLSYKITKKINRFNYLNFESLICKKYHKQD